MEERKWQASIFGGLWAVAHLGHFLFRGAPADPVVWAIVLAAMAVLYRPGEAWRLGVLAAIQVVDMLWSQPMVDNHYLIMGAVNMGILFSLLFARADRGEPALTLSFAYIRNAFLVAYGFAALAKLNAGFFDPTVSCAVSMFYDMVEPVVPASMLPFPGWLEQSMPFFVAGVEVAIPLMLAFRRTRRWAFALIVGFHVLMPIMPTVPGGIFTFVLFAVSFLFLPLEVVAHMRRRLAPLRRLVGEGRRRGAVLLACFVLYTLLRWELLGWAHHAVEIAGLVVVGAWLADAAYHAPDRPMRWRMGHPIYFVFLLAIALNALSPFMGAKTTPTFTMYSNLQTEGGVSNHFIFPRWPGETAQDRWVVIEASDDPVLQSVKEQERMLSHHELRRTLSQNPEAHVRFRDGDQVIELERAGDHEEWSTFDPIWHRLIYHRAIFQEGPMCTW